MYQEVPPLVTDVTLMISLIPSSHCLGFIRHQDLRQPVKLCKFKPENIETPEYQKVQQKSKLLLHPEKEDDDNESDDDNDVVDDDNDSERAKDDKRPCQV